MHASLWINHPCVCDSSLGVSCGKIKKKRKYTGDGRTNSTRPDPGTTYDVFAIDWASGAPFEPDGVGKSSRPFAGSLHGNELTST